MFIDTHCHLSRQDYDNIDMVIEESKQSGVDIMIISGCSKESIEESLELSRKFDNIYVTLGYHPSEATSVTDADLVELETLLKSDKVVGLGEIGLDYYYGKEDKQLQISLFEKQLAIASELKLPVVIHSRDAVKDTIDILKKYSVTGVIHCFGGSLETARLYIGMGYSLGIGGVLTFKNSNLSKVVEQLPLESLVLETDSPYLAPTPYRGKQNSSKYIPIIADFLAQIKGVSSDYVANVTTNNAKRIFKVEK